MYQGRTRGFKHKFIKMKATKKFLILLKVKTIPLRNVKGVSKVFQMCWKNTGRRFGIYTKTYTRREWRWMKKIKSLKNKLEKLTTFNVL